MAANIKDPLLLPLYGSATVVESITKPTGVGAVEAFLGYTRLGALPAADGNYVAGICTKSSAATNRNMPIATTGFAIVRVKPAATIALDGAVSIAATGEAIPAASGYVAGRALDSSTGSTSQMPQYIVIKLT
jgi:hypothetical protein